MSDLETYWWAGIATIIFLSIIGVLIAIVYTHTEETVNVVGGAIVMIVAVAVGISLIIVVGYVVLEGPSRIRNWIDR